MRVWSKAIGALRRHAQSLLCAALMLSTLAVAGDRIDTIERVKASVVAVGTFERTRAPQFQFLGTGFVVGDGTLIATNAHVLPAVLDPAKLETLAILLPGMSADGKDLVQVREVKRLSVDPASDLALLKQPGPPLPALAVREGGAVKEGQEVLFTGYPIGSVLGPFPATHRGMISVVTPIAIPQARAGDLDAKTVRRLSSGNFAVYQLDATAYPGNSGSPVYDPESAEVLAIVNMVFVKGTKEAVLAQPSGITYAIPASHLRDLLKAAR
jgi:S1-C subfamily serine protease